MTVKAHLFCVLTMCGIWLPDQISTFIRLKCRCPHMSSVCRCPLKLSKINELFRWSRGHLRNSHLAQVFRLAIHWLQRELTQLSCRKNCKCSVLNLCLESNTEINKICHPSFCNSTQRYSKCDCTQSVGLLFVLFLKIKKKTNSRIGIRQRLWSQSHRWPLQLKDDPSIS